MKSLVTSNLDHPPSRAGAPLCQRLVSVCLLAASLVLGAVNVSVADDTEIFRSTFDAQNDGAGRPKVLIIFDNSGSMSGLTEEKKPYDPAVTYSNAGGIDSNNLYWTENLTGEPPTKDTNNWVKASKNRCASSTSPLANQGFYIGKLARWKAESKTKDSKWMNLATSGSDRDPPHFDCLDDITNSNASNPGHGANGYPATGSSGPYVASKTSAVDASGWKSYRVYTANYMNWYYGTNAKVFMSKLEVAQRAITDLVSANPGIDFGLEIFNPNSSTNNGYPGDTNGGGYIYRRIIDGKDQTETERATDRNDLLTKINGLTASTWTPLCESTYEAYLYLAGKEVAYAAKAAGNGPANRDKSAEDPAGTYKSPAGACQFTYVILMTDGMPTYDRSANALVEALTKKTCNTYATDSGQGMQKNCLPELTEYMYTHDLDEKSDNGVQRAITYTIGFQTNQVLLSDAARRGGGLYYTANSAEDLAAAFHGAITAILSTAGSFTAPSVAVDTFTRTESRNEVFFAMFEPQEGTDWPGNIKKLRIDITNGNAVLKDANDAVAMDGSGKISDGARTYWSSEADGSAVKKGGVGGVLANRDPDTRKIWINTGTAGALENFQASNVTATKFGLVDEAALLGKFDVGSRTELDGLLDWARGWEDSSKSSKREWILGDMLHSRPLVLNYGARGSHTKTDPDIRIVVGTNAGFLHMFDNADGKENWAFFPKELASVLKKRRDNVKGADVVWGVDGSAVFYSKDLNNDGTIDSSAGDKLYLYFGLRRGGKAYYALDVSNPDSPTLLWKIDKATTGFGELGQTWSSPVITYIPGHVDGAGKPKPVLVFGGGYDVGKDSTTAVAGDDSEGRGIFIVDAATGALVWSVTPANNSGTNMKSADLKHSIPAQLTVLDSNGDGLIDRMYATDTGGNIWRLDLPGNSLPATAQDKWFLTRLAALNTSASTSPANHAGDRRFFYPVDLVRTMSQRDGVFDAVLVGSGDRENPNATDNDDRFYMIRDRNTGIYATRAPTTSECATSQDFRCKLPIKDSDLYDISDNLIQTGDAAQKSAAEAGLKAAAGWYIDLEAADGEKALARPLTIAGTVYFTTFSPGDDSQNLCVPAPGTGRLYAVRLLDGRAVIDFNADGQLERTAKLGTLIPDTPSPHFGSDKKIRLLFPSGGGLQGAGNPLETGAHLRAPFGTYWYNEEY